MLILAKYTEIMLLLFTLRACFHGGGGLQVGEVTCLGRFYNLSYGHPTYHVNVIELK